GADAVAIAAEIGSDHVKVLGEPAHDLVPRHMRQRVAVQEQQRRSVAAMPQMDAGAAKRGGSGLDLGAGEAFEHRGKPSLAGPQVIPSCIRRTPESMAQGERSRHYRGQPKREETTWHRGRTLLCGRLRYVS